jgi:hypothetical protein
MPITLTASEALINCSAEQVRAAADRILLETADAATSVWFYSAMRGLANMLIFPEILDIFTTAVFKSDFGNGDLTLLDRPDEVIAGIGVDFPINRYFQPILEFRSTQYVGGRTPNAFENSPLDALGGVRFFPTRYISMGAAYRYHINQQNEGSFGDDRITTRTTVSGAGGGTFTSTFTGIPPGFVTSTDPHGFIFQLFGWTTQRA